MLLRRTLLVASSLLLAAGARAAPAVGTPAPDFELRDTNGKPVRLADFRGQHVVLEWTNPGCPYVRKHYDSGNMPATQRYATGRGVVWLSINSTERTSYDWREPAQLVAWQKERQAASTALLMDEDGVAGKAYGARTTPHLYIVDPQGRLVYAGGIDSIPSSNPDDIRKATNYVRVGLDEALAGKPLTTAVSRPYGCAIKYKG
jgi:peroxiredoxin